MNKELEKVSGGYMNVNGDLNTTGNFQAVDNSQSETVDNTLTTKKEKINRTKIRQITGLIDY